MYRYQHGVDRREAIKKYKVKEIARETNVSYRTVEGLIAHMMESLGCSSSKELIALYHDHP
jgi:DNA-binding NarL/FixJ family response regulator